MREVRTICWCGKKAGMVVRRGADGKAQRAGEQVQIGGNDVYVSLCRRHYREEVGDVSPLSPTSGAAQALKSKLPTTPTTAKSAKGGSRLAVHVGVHGTVAVDDETVEQAEEMVDLSKLDLNECAPIGLVESDSPK